jgi:Spy/CpxP family protein refolding chaperone
MDAHFETFFTKILPDGTPKQRAQLNVIANSVHTDLGTFHAQFRTTHQRAHVLLLRSTVDRAGLEALRVEQMQQADLMSRRIVRGLADAAEVLTPSQRVRLAAHLAARNKGAGL